MEGFFSKKETESLSRPDGKSLSCVSCGLYKSCISPKIQPYGKFKKGIMNIGEAPGETEDKNGKPWQGRTGKLLQKVYYELGIDLFEDCINIKAANCRPSDDNGENRTPTNFEIECCRRIVLKAIADYKPKIIVLFGNSALYSLIAHRWKKDFGSISKWRGFCIPDQDLKAWVIPTFHPSYIERTENDDVSRVIWKNDLQKVVDHLETPFPIYKEPKIEIIEDLNILKSLKKNSPIVIDFETTGKKPHAKGHKIICSSVATSPDHVYVFMIPESRSELQPFIDVLVDKDIPKKGQNIKFEHAWSWVIFRKKIIGWVWDTMLASHIIDNRQGITGLKFQVFVQFGIVDYSSEIAPYLQSVDDTSANSLNRIDELLKRPGGKEKLLKYCALDAIFEYRLADLQYTLILEHCLPF